MRSRLCGCSRARSTRDAARVELRRSPCWVQEVGDGVAPGLLKAYSTGAARGDGRGVRHWGTSGEAWIGVARIGSGRLVERREHCLTRKTLAGAEMNPAGM